MTQPTDAGAEYRQVAELITDAATGVTGTVERMHGAIARRPFGAFGAPAAPARGLHNAISTVVYTSIKAGIAAGGALAATAAGLYGSSRPAESLIGTSAGRTAAGMLSGAFGDRVLTPATTMSVRIDGSTVALEPEQLATAFPATTGHIVVFLHGLIETERWWYPRPQEGQPPRHDFGTRLSTDIGSTAVYVRYNTGQHISVNGRELDELLTGLVDAWPVPVEQISLVGHSMGGLVARSAAHQAAEAQHAWADRLAHVICLGTPHTGSPLEAGAHALSWALRRFAESAPLGELLDSRSDGIKDLRFGYLHDDEWSSDTDAPFKRSPRTETRLPEQARMHFFTATISTDPDSPLGRAFGDALVTPDSASDLSLGAGRHYAGGLHHFDLLHHDTVYEQVRAWLTKATRTPQKPTDQHKPRFRERLRRKRAAN